MEFIIDRSKWRNGYTSNYAKGLGYDTRLLNELGHMCCLGQICLQLGCTENDILNKLMPEDVYSKTEEDKLKNVLLNDLGCNTDLSDDAMQINDCGSSTIKEKEKQLKKLFKEHGHTIKFVGRSVKYKHEC
jgi:hypothetical protein